MPNDKRWIWWRVEEKGCTRSGDGWIEWRAITY